MNKNILDKLKILVTGDSATGKTSFIRRYCEDKFDESYKPSIDSDYYSKTEDIDGKKYNIKIYDLTGVDKGGVVTKSFAKDSLGFIVLCSANKKDYDS